MGLHRVGWRREHSIVRVCMISLRRFRYADFTALISLWEFRCEDFALGIA